MICNGVPLQFMVPTGPARRTKGYRTAMRWQSLAASKTLLTGALVPVMVIGLWLSGCKREQIASHPTIRFSKVPPEDAGGPNKIDVIAGYVTGARPDQKIILFAKAGAWYVQPLANEPFTTIQPDSSWKSSTHLGTEYAALLVDPSYQPRMTMDALPGEGAGIVAVATTRGTPPVWQTWWFQVLVVLAAALLVLLLYRIRMHQKITEMNVRFEERLAERARIAQDLHDTLLQGILSASMHLHVANNKLPDDSPAKPLLNQVQQLMDHVINEGRISLQGLRSSSDDPRKLEQAFSRIPQELGDDKEVAYRVVVEGSPRPLHPVIRDEVYRIGREALVNAFRHAAAGSIEIQVEYTAAHLRVAVRDDGRGIDPHVLQGGRDGHWGLPGMRERAERIGAKLNLWSRLNAGTEVELLVPHEVAYQQQSVNGRMNWVPKLRGPKRTEED